MITPKEEFEINMRGCDLISKRYAEQLFKERNEALAKAERLDKYLSERIDREVEKVKAYRLSAQKWAKKERGCHIYISQIDAEAQRILSERKSKGV